MLICPNVKLITLIDINQCLPSARQFTLLIEHLGAAALNSSHFIDYCVPM